MIQVGEYVGITGPKSVAHFRRVMPGVVEAIEEWNGQAPVHGKPRRKENGTYEKAYMIRFADGTNYIGPYESRELTKQSPGEFEALKSVPDPFA